jgi:hypothetical protein
MGVGQGIGLPVSRNDVDEAMSQLSLQVRQLQAFIALDLLPWAADTTLEMLNGTDPDTPLDRPYTVDQAYMIKASLDRCADWLALMAGGDPAVALPADRWPHDLLGDLARMKGLAGR